MNTNNHAFYFSGKVGGKVAETMRNAPKIPYDKIQEERKELEQQLWNERNQNLTK